MNPGKGRNAGIVLFALGALAFAGIQVRSAFVSTGPDPPAAESEIALPAGEAGGAGEPRPTDRGDGVAPLLAATQRGSPFVSSNPFRARDLRRAVAPLVVRAILEDGPRSLALVGDRLLRIGDRIPSANEGVVVEVTGIAGAGVTLRLGSETVVLPLRVREAGDDRNPRPPRGTPARREEPHDP